MALALNLAMITAATEVWVTPASAGSGAAVGTGTFSESRCSADAFDADFHEQWTMVTLSTPMINVSLYSAFIILVTSALHDATRMCNMEIL